VLFARDAVEAFGTAVQTGALVKELVVQAGETFGAAGTAVARCLAVHAEGPG
jgi:hypothetical protein